MKEQCVGIRELKARLSQCVSEVKKGATIVVTEHGRRVARIVPEAASLDERLNVLKDSGAVLWSGRRLGSTGSAVKMKGKPAVSEILIEDRR